MHNYQLIHIYGNKYMQIHRLALVELHMKQASQRLQVNIYYMRIICALFMYNVYKGYSQKQQSSLLILSLVSAQNYR
jgi:hypothetical protein